MSKEIQEIQEVEELETAQSTETQETASTEKKSKKEYTAEEIASVKAASSLVASMGVSENLNKVLILASAWNEKENVGKAKEVTIAAFGTSQNFKDYIDGAFITDVEAIAGMQKLASTLNNIKSFYARREASKKFKMTQVTIAGVLYDVNTPYFKSLMETDMSIEAKREAVLAHADTKKVSIEIESL